MNLSLLVFVCNYTCLKREKVISRSKCKNTNKSLTGFMGYDKGFID